MKTKTKCRKCGEFLELIDVPDGLRYSCPTPDCPFHITAPIIEKKS